ncbi:hypothetical protein ANO11243_020270 [Dothideomycetidae sp. 11243]|nr:hypothetical protein ANO11243_020270 [fungal sp. No.11243]
MAGVKRKTLHDYFGQEDKLKMASASTADTPTSTSVSISNTAAATITTATEHALLVPAGLSIIHGFVSEDEELAILSFLEEQAWRTDLSRRSLHFGGTYCVMPPRDSSPGTRRRIEQTIITAPSMPAELEFVLQRMVDRGLYVDSARPAYCIVNEYRPGQGISAHVENFRFGEPVCALTLAGCDTMRFHQLQKPHDGSVRSGKAASAPRSGKRQDVDMARRSLLIMRGEARHSWQHEIVRGRTRSRPPAWKRVSLTFRVDKKG